ncbi:hypothetical protein MNBD_GAMMA08-1726 [hydrothermal vent metagenome]|uniref:Peptidase S54 rhomboid domain-containing protein n=1 Tax=hydrothermal vent metagenome TaxID=652676 RepID=A0A3B0X9Y6_9ZZZZ
MTQLSSINFLHKLRSYKLWLVLFTLCLLIQTFDLQSVLRFDRQLIVQGQIWRLISAHLTHLNWPHFMLNMAGLSLIAIFFSHYKSTKYWLGALFFIALFCSAGLLLDNQLNKYVGFSGVLHGLFIVGGRWELRRYTLSGVVLLTLIIGKIVWEQMFGALPGSESMVNGRVAINAHLYGGIAGVVYLFRRG